MKNKRAIYILLPLVIIIWGVIAYQIISALNKSKSNSQPQRQASIKDPDFLMKPDTFSLLKNYPDPFLKNKADIAKVKVGQGVVQKVKKLASKSKWPDVNYLGMVKGKKSKKMVSLLLINGDEYIVKVGDTLFGMKVLKINSDSVELKLGKDKKFFLK